MSSMVSDTDVTTQVSEVSLDIDYEIIEHFSENLYSSPNKAIEELVANGFDAFATCVNVFLPGEYTPERVVVWDNGGAMDVDGLKGLWKLASSPKRSIPNRVVTKSGEKRKVIGKFGIGKLASYTVGNVVSHLCRVNTKFWLVQVDYIKAKQELPTSSEGDTPKDKAYRSPIYELTEDQAKDFVLKQFAKPPNNIDRLFNETTWTFALISELKRNDLYRNRLSWVLGNGMPLRPDFKVWVDLEEVVPKLARDGAAVEWDLGSQEIEKNLQKMWDDGVKQGYVAGTLSYGVEAGLDPTQPEEEIQYVSFPGLGKVWGEIRLFDYSLEAVRSKETGRSYGFFLMVRGRLVNPNDETIYLSDPSYGTFYRSQYILHVDGLDQDLLADRERLRVDEPRAEELRILQKAVYSTTRIKQQVRDNEAAEAALPGSRLPTFSREYFIEPLTALWMKKHPDNELGFDLHETTIIGEELGENFAIADLSPTGKGFAVNKTHPYYQSLEGQFGHGKKGQAVVKEYELLAVSEQLFLGFLYEIGVPDDKVKAISEWRDQMYRVLANRNKKSIYALSKDLTEASYKSGAVFEEAIVDVMQAMGFSAKRDGAKGKKDILLVAPAGTGSSYKFTIEAKGASSGSVENDSAEVGGAVAHRDAVGAEHAIIIAREFKGFKRVGQDEPAIIQECRAAKNVSIMQVDALISMVKVMNRYLYPLDNVKDIFTALESPEEKLKKIEKLNQPLETFDYRGLLDRIWKHQDEVTEGEDVPYLSLYYGYKKSLSEEDLANKLAALQALAYPLVQNDVIRQRVALKQSPNIIAILIERKLESMEGD